MGLRKKNYIKTRWDRKTFLILRILITLVQILGRLVSEFHPIKVTISKYHDRWKGECFAILTIIAVQFCKKNMKIS